MVCLKYVPANSKTSPASLKHRHSEGAALYLSNREAGTKHIFSQREDSQACSCYASILHDGTQCFMGGEERRYQIQIEIGSDYSHEEEPRPGVWGAREGRRK